MVPRCSLTGSFVAALKGADWLVESECQLVRELWNLCVFVRFCVQRVNSCQLSG